jgi:hypothetical protein
LGLPGDGPAGYSRRYFAGIQSSIRLFPCASGGRNADFTASDPVHRYSTEKSLLQPFAGSPILETSTGKLHRSRESGLGVFARGGRIRPLSAAVGYFSDTREVGGMLCKRAYQNPALDLAAVILSAEYICENHTRAAWQPVKDMTANPATPCQAIAKSGPGEIAVNVVRVSGGSETVLVSEMQHVLKMRPDCVATPSRRKNPRVGLTASNFLCPTSNFLTPTARVP